MQCPARHSCGLVHRLGVFSQCCVGAKAHEAERDVSARTYVNIYNCPGGQARSGARAPCRSLAIAPGSVTTSRIFIRPPHLEQLVTSTAKTRACRFPQPMRRGLLNNGHFAELIGKSWDEAERELELERGRRLRRGRDDTSAEAMAAGEDTVIARHVESRRLHQSAEATEKRIAKGPEKESTHWR